MRFSIVSMFLKSPCKQFTLNEKHKHKALQSLTQPTILFSLDDFFMLETF